MKKLDDLVIYLKRFIEEQEKKVKYKKGPLKRAGLLELILFVLLSLVSLYFTVICHYISWNTDTVEKAKKKLYGYKMWLLGGQPPIFFSQNWSNVTWDPSYICKVSLCSICPLNIQKQKCSRWKSKKNYVLFFFLLFYEVVDNWCQKQHQYIPSS